ncbi:MAG: DUF5360 family protein [Bacteroidetes bacterium]|nr:DUF5360 family protein [Bacteroidota bacterium]
MKHLPKFFLVVDIGFIVYWLVTALHLIPEEYLYNDYQNPLLVSWNWSFLSIDLLISFSGLYSLYLRRSRIKSWTNYAFISLVLTSASGLMAVSFWTVTKDFDPLWWAPNLFLLIYPIYFLRLLIRESGTK